MDPVDYHPPPLKVSCSFHIGARGAMAESKDPRKSAEKYLEEKNIRSLIRHLSTKVRFSSTQHSPFFLPFPFHLSPLFIYPCTLLLPPCSCSLLSLVAFPCTDEGRSMFVCSFTHLKPLHVDFVCKAGGPARVSSRRAEKNPRMPAAASPGISSGDVSGAGPLRD